MIRSYAVCEECQESEILYETVQDPDFRYEGIVEGDSDKFDEIEGWIVKGTQSPDDPLVVEFEYYCPECVTSEEIADSGDRVPE